MADALLDLLADDLPAEITAKGSQEAIEASAYLQRLTSLSYNDIVTKEKSVLSAATHTANLALQSLASRSYQSFINASDQLSTVPTSLDKLTESIKLLQSSLPSLDARLATFSTTYHKSSPLLQERNRKHTLARTFPRLLDILELPSLLQSAISSSNPSLALDIHSHVRRLSQLYPETPIIRSISHECDDLLQVLNAQLLTTLRQAIKLPAAIKTIGYLKRTSPDVSGGEEVWGSIFLVARLSFLNSLFQALDPLRELADAEREEWAKLQQATTLSSSNTASLPTKKLTKGGGHQTERYLKRWIEVFREQSFAIVTMYRAIFPATGTTSLSSTAYLQPTTPKTPLPPRQKEEDDFVDDSKTPSPLATFIPHLLSLLTSTLRNYLPVVSDRSARESLLTQVLYAAGSLGRLGGDFGMILSTGILGVGDQDGQDDLTEEDAEGGEWVEIMNKHKVLAGRLEELAAGRGIRSPSSSPLLT